MRARELITDATFDPDQLKAVGSAFDDAWAQIAPDVSKQAEAIEAACLKLAKIVLVLAKSKGIQDPPNLAQAAIEAMFDEPTELKR